MELKVISRDADAVRMAALGEIRQAALEENPDPVRSLLDERGYATAVVIGLGGVTFMDSSGIGWLLKCHKRAREAGGRFVVHSLPPGVMDVMKMMRLDKVLHIAENEPASRSMLEGVKL
jgi:anti-anti-sigma factor